jgi:RNA polymerase sigma-70 factor (ECF subfamily)
VVDRPPDENERAVVRRAQEGDATAYEEIVRRYERTAFRAAYFVTRNAADAEDAVQDAFVKAWRALHRFDSRKPLRPWLLTIVVNEARTRSGAARRRQELSLRLTSENAEATAPSPEESLTRRSELGRALAAYQQLPADQQAVVAARFFLQLSEAETAEVLNLRLGTVKSRLSRALKRINLILEEQR